jgi:hypothetical protein
LEREEARRREEREWEEGRRREEAEAARLREEREEARRKEMRDLQEQELQIQRNQWEWQKSLTLRDREKQQAPAVQIKFFGCVLKNVMPRFRSDIADVPIVAESLHSRIGTDEGRINKIVKVHFVHKNREKITRTCLRTRKQHADST